jgi:hypothetical protein
MRIRRRVTEFQKTAALSFAPTA